MLFHNEWSTTQLVTKNDVTGDSIQSKVSSKAYLDNYDAIFGKKDQKNEDRGRYGEDESNKDEIPSNSFRPG